MGKLTVIDGGRSTAARFEALIQPHYEALFRAAYRFTRSVPDAEDLVQDTCVRAYPRLDELESLEQPRAWLIRVLRRLYIDQTRRYERKHVSSVETVEPALLVSNSPGPAEATELSLQTQRLERAWNMLDRDQRSLVSLHDVEGYSLAELREMTGLKEGTLKSRLHRARTKLGRLLRIEEEAAQNVAVSGVGQQ